MGMPGFCLSSPGSHLSVSICCWKLNRGSVIGLLRDGYAKWAAATSTTSRLLRFAGTWQCMLENTWKSSAAWSWCRVLVTQHGTEAFCCSEDDYRGVKITIYLCALLYLFHDECLKNVFYSPFSFIMNLSLTYFHGTQFWWILVLFFILWYIYIYISLESDFVFSLKEVTGLKQRGWVNQRFYTIKHWKRLVK